MNFEYCENDPGGPLTYFNDGGGPKDFLGSEILAKRDFFGSMKDAGIFLGRENNTGIFWVLYSSSAQINNNISTILVLFLTKTKVEVGMF